MAPPPYELLDEILFRLPVKYLLRCRCVSKEWCSVVDNKAFVKKHHRRSIERDPDGGVIICGDGKVFLTDSESLRDDDVEVIELKDSLLSGAELVGVANGLACLCKSNRNEFVLCNPATRMCRKLPRVPSVFASEVPVPLAGFGYDSVSDDYKVVKILECKDCVKVVVYSLKSDSWKRLEDIGGKFCIVPAWGVFADGALHWVVLNCCIIFGFDLGLEQFKELPLPDINVIDSLLHVGGSLCIPDTHRGFHTDVWLMNNHGAENPWCKAFSVEQRGAFETFRGFVRPVAFSNSGKDVLLKVDYRNTTLVWYDREKKVGRKIRIHGVPVKFNARLYTESLFQLTEGKQLQKKRKRRNNQKKVASQ